MVHILQLLPQKQQLLEPQHNRPYDMITKRYVIRELNFLAVISQMTLNWPITVEGDLYSQK